MPVCQFIGGFPRESPRVSPGITLLALVFVLVQVHKECCPNRRMVCIQGCGALLVAKEIEVHLTSECSKRPCTCKHCKRPIPFDTMEVKDCMNALPVIQEMGTTLCIIPLWMLSMIKLPLSVGKL